MRELERRLERLEKDRFVTDDGIEAIFITIVDNTKEGQGRDLPTYGWRFQRYGTADVVTMRNNAEDDDSLRERHMNAVQPLLVTGSVPMFLPVTSQE